MKMAKLSGTTGTILETFEGLSQASDAKTATGASNYYRDVLYSQSKYIYWMDHETTLANAGTAKKGLTFDQQGTNTLLLCSRLH